MARRGAFLGKAMWKLRRNPERSAFESPLADLPGKSNVQLELAGIWVFGWRLGGIEGTFSISVARCLVELDLARGKADGACVLHGKVGNYGRQR